MGQACAIFNSGAPGSDTLVDYFNTNFHISGEHYLDAWRTASCYYQNGRGIGNPCIATLQISDTPQIGENGSVTGAHHVIASSTKGGSSSGYSPSASAEAAAGVASCPYTNCTVSVSLGGVVTVSPSGGAAVWSATDTYNTFCPQQIEGCPIIIDTANEGFQLTNAADGVDTEMVIPGHRPRFGWTKRGSHNAFLWLDGHLFGNYTEQPLSDNPNGFAALAAYDSNGDGIIDAKDPVYTQLRLWIDANHDGVVQPNELSTLPSLGVNAISLRYKTDKYVDEFGNHFRYRGSLRAAASNVDHTVYDVFLTIN